MENRRNYSRYDLRQGRKIVHTGITRDLERREREHQEQFPGSKASQVGPKVTEKGARKWEQEQRDKGKPTETPKKRK